MVRFGVLPAAGSDCGDRGAGGDDLVVSVADLTGPLTAGQSPEVPKEEHNLRLFRPEFTESLLGAVGIDEDQISEVLIYPSRYDRDYQFEGDQRRSILGQVGTGARMGIRDDFFELGGTSLTAMQVILRLCQEFDIDLPLETMFSHPILGELARVAEDRILADVAEIPDRERQRLLGEIDTQI